MAQQLSPTRKFKLITGKDIFKASKELEKTMKDEESNDATEMVEFVQYGLYLAFYNPDMTKAKEEFNKFIETGELDTGSETVKSLMEKFKATFG
ncbi:hypothetical protein [Lactococcus formosensis]|uniref:hypothetical protein n=1 Tax=Lactococcus formosensis TaxID=1281486 RepID=UPI0031FE976E